MVVAMAGDDKRGGDGGANDNGDRPTPSPGYHASVKPPATLDELGAFLVDMHKGTRDGFATVYREQSKTNDLIKKVDARVEHVEEVVEEHGDLIDDIAAEVFDASGPRKPPARVAARLVRRKPSSSMRPRMPSLTSRQDGLEAKLDELAGVVARVDARTEKGLAHSETVESINKAQARAMGLSKPEESTWRKFVNLAVSREGAKLAGGFLTAITAIVGMVAALMAKGSAEKANANAERAADRPPVVLTAPSSSASSRPPLPTFDR